VRHHMEMVLHYLCKVFRITMPVARLACGPDTWNDISMYWTENSDISGLRSFRFDGLDDYLRSREPDRSLAGLVSYLACRAQPELMVRQIHPRDNIPSKYLPAFPTDPVFVQNPCFYGPPILRNENHAESNLN